MHPFRKGLLRCGSGVPGCERHSAGKRSCAERNQNDQPLAGGLGTKSQPVRLYDVSWLILLVWLRSASDKRFDFYHFLRIRDVTVHLQPLMWAQSETFFCVFL